MKLFGLVLLIVLESNTLAYKEKDIKTEGIIGGNRAHEGQFKYYVSFQYYGIHRCGGALINDQFAITAAHCLFSLKTGIQKEGPFSILAAAVNAVTPHLFAIRVRVIEAFVPAVYVPMCLIPDGRSSGDIAVLKLSQNFNIDNLSSKLSKLKIPLGSIPEYNVKLIITGHGYNYKRSLHSAGPSVRKDAYGDGLLRFSEAEIVSNELCNIYYNSHVHNDDVCARLVQRNRNYPVGTCAYDSGGPLVYNDENLIGILTGGPEDCNENRKPSIYTNATYYWPFIHNVTKGQITSNMQHIIYDIRIG